ncbi:hypothetical protein ACFE04_021472 [Oxalis oulophora]
MSSGINILQLSPEYSLSDFTVPFLDVSFNHVRFIFTDSHRNLLNLELPDRKSVRLSCRSFYDACNRISIITKRNSSFVVDIVFKTSQNLAIMPVFAIKFGISRSSIGYVPRKNMDPLRSKSSGIESIKPFDDLVKQKVIRKRLETFEYLRSLVSINVLNLRTLKDFLFDIPSDGHWLKKFIYLEPSKRLEFLKLRFNVNDSRPDKVMSTVKLSVNRNLHTLIIDSHNSSENDYVLIMEYFQNLKHLDLCFITDAVLQAIIKNQANLEVLKLNHVDNCTDFGFTGRRSKEDSSQPGYSIRRLKSDVWISIAGSSEGFTEETFLEFRIS